MNNSLDTKQFETIIDCAIKEDIGTGDITTDNIIPDGCNVTGRFIAKENGVIAGLQVVEHVFSRFGEKVVLEPLVKDGDHVTAGDSIAVIKGDAKIILPYERLSLNFLQRLSGIATLTSVFVNKVKEFGITIVDTRKTTPGWRYLEKYAVRAGGGVNHRSGLYDQVLIKDNHLSILNNSLNSNTGNKKSIIDIVRSLREKLPQTVLIELEVDFVSKVNEALESGADIILLDNMDRAQIDESLTIVDNWQLETNRKRPVIEISGGVTLENLARIACPGIDRIAIGAITHSVKALDISLDLEV